MPDQAVYHSLTEHIEDWKTREVQIDPHNRIVKNVALTGTESRNGYRYSEQALIDSVALYENKPVFLDHPASSGKPHHRSTRDLVGSVINTRYEAGRIRGDIRVIDTEAGRTFLALAETNGPAVGMSHVVLAEKNADGSVIERIHEVVSVDAVVFPATTTSFQEQQRSTNGGTALESSLAWLTIEREALVEQIARLKSELTELESQRDVDLLLEQTHLPPWAVTAVFREQLLAAPTTEARRTLIQERRTLLDALARTSPIPRSQERPSDLGASPQTLTDDQFVNALRRR